MCRHSFWFSVTSESCLTLYDAFSRSKGDSAVFVLDSETSECLHYEPVQGYPATHVASIPREVLASHSEVEIRNDFIDCCIDVCSVEASLEIPSKGDHNIYRIFFS